MEYFISSIVVWLCFMGIIYCIYMIIQEFRLKKLLKFRLSEIKLPTFIERCIRIDAAFTLEEKIVIIESLKEWEDKTSNLVAFNIINLEANEIHIDGKMPPEAKSYEYYEVFTFIKATSSSDIVKKLEEDTEKKAYGYAHCGDFLYISMIIDRIPNKEIFKSVAMHEVGHLLGMSHLKNKKVLMNKYVNCKINTLTKEDLIHFLKNYGLNTTNRPQEALQQLLLQQQAKNIYS